MPPPDFTVANALLLPAAMPPKLLHTGLTPNPRPIQTGAAGAGVSGDGGDSGGALGALGFLHYVMSK